MVRNGDMAFAPSGWYEVTTSGYQISRDQYPHRRFVEIPDFTPRDARTDPPKVGDSDERGYVLIFNKWWYASSWNSIGSATHWLPQPPAPVPAKTDSEKAWEAWCENGKADSTYKSHTYQAFIAGYEARDAKK